MGLALGVIGNSSFPWFTRDVRTAIWTAWDRLVELNRAIEVRISYVTGEGVGSDEM